MSGTQSRAKATISLRTIEQIKPVEFKWASDSQQIGFTAQQIAPLPSSFFQSVNGGNLGVSGQVLQSTGVGYAWASTGQHNVATGYQAGYGIGQGIQLSNTARNNTIQFNGTDNQPVLIITQDGDVEWHGKPSEAAEAMKRTFQFTVEDMKGVTKAARRRYYYKAVDNLSKKSRTMSAEQFVDFVQKQAYNRERRVILDSLKGNNVNS